MDFIHALFPLKEAPSANSKYAWLHRLLKRNQRSKKNSHDDGHGNVQDNEIAVLDPSQESEKMRPGSSMPVCIAVPRIQTEFLIKWISTRSSSTLLLTLTLLLIFLLPSRHSSF